MSILAGTRDDPVYAGRSAVDVAANQGSRALALADFNQDGRLDIATANQQVGLATVLLNQTPFTRTGFSFSKSSIGPEGDIQSSGDRVIPATSIVTAGRTSRLSAPPTTAWMSSSLAVRE